MGYSQYNESFEFKDWMAGGLIILLIIGVISAVAYECWYESTLSWRTEFTETVLTDRTHKGAWSQTVSYSIPHYHHVGKQNWTTYTTGWRTVHHEEENHVYLVKDGEQIHFDNKFIYDQCNKLAIGSKVFVLEKIGYDKKLEKIVRHNFLPQILVK